MLTTHAPPLKNRFFLGANFGVFWELGALLEELTHRFFKRFPATLILNCVLHLEYLPCVLFLSS